MIPHSIFDLDHVDPLQLVAEYSNDMTMSVDLIATRMAIIGNSHPPSSISIRSYTVVGIDFYLFSM